MFTFPSKSVQSFHFFQLYNRLLPLGSSLMRPPCVKTCFLSSSIVSILGVDAEALQTYDRKRIYLFK